MAKIVKTETQYEEVVRGKDTYQITTIINYVDDPFLREQMSQFYRQLMAIPPKTMNKAG